MAEEFIEWSEKCSTGIEKIDEQHRELFRMTNDLHTNSLKAETLNESFTEAMHEAVAYVRGHFSLEEQILEHFGYPYLEKHRAMHTAFVKKVLATDKEYMSGRATLATFDFVRFLRDWIMSHIMVNDMEWAGWVRDHVAETAKQAAATEPAAHQPA
jgi:hemerythrin-like metal-binding protein